MNNYRQVVKLISGVSICVSVKGFSRIAGGSKLQIPYTTKTPAKFSKIRPLFSRVIESRAFSSLAEYTEGEEYCHGSQPGEF